MRFRQLKALLLSQSSEYEYSKSGDYVIQYLNNRKQFPSVNGANSQYAIITCGVSQWSVLGQITFLLFNNNMTSVVSAENLRLFADVTNLFINSKSVKELN